MNSHQLDNLVSIGQLKPEPKSRSEFDGLLHSAQVRLEDARKESLSGEYWPNATSVGILPNMKAVTILKNSF